MRVVDEHRHAAVVGRVDALKTARDLRGLAQRVDDGAGRKAQLHADAERAHDVLNVELAHQGVIELVVRAAHVERDGRVRGEILHVFGVDLRGAIKTGGDDVVAGVRATAQQFLAPFVVDADDATRRVVFAEQARLGLEVGLERVVVVQMVLR